MKTILRMWAVSMILLVSLCLYLWAFVTGAGL